MALVIERYNVNMVESLVSARSNVSPGSAGNVSDNLINFSITWKVASIRWIPQLITNY